MRAFLIPVFILAGSSTHAQWITQSNFGNQAARAVAFSDADHGFVAVYGGFKRTADGGSSWADAGYVGADTLHRFYKETRAVHAFTADEAIACGVDLWSNTEMILRTVDGGLDWDTVHAGPFGTELNDLHFVSASIGMAVGGDGRIFRSLNGGYTWSAQVSGTAADLFGVYFVDALVGIAVGDHVILRTTDGGSSWSVQSAPVALRGIAAFDASAWMASGDAGTALLSEDGGATWVDRPIPFNDPDLYRLSVLDANTVHVGADALIYVTHDRGLLWEKFDMDPSGYIVLDIQADASLNGTGYAAGLFGRVYKTTAASDAGHPLIAAVPDTLGACVGESIFFDNLSSTTYSTVWKLDGAAVSASTDATIVFPAAGSHNVRMVVSNGLYQDSLQFQVQVQGVPSIQSFNVLASPSQVCPGASAQLFVTPGQTGVSYQLLVGGVPIGTAQTGTGSMLTFQIAAAQAGGVYAIQATRSGACGVATSTVNSPLVVLALPLTSLAVTLDPAVLCAPGPVSLIVTGTEVGVNYTARNGNVVVSGPQAGNGGTLTFSLGSVNAANTYNVRAVTVVGGCAVVLDQQPALIYAPMDAAFTVDDPYPFVGQTVSIINNATAVAFEWSLGADAMPQTSTLASPQVSYAQIGAQLITVQMTNAEGCTDQSTMTVQVTAPAPDLSGAVCWSGLSGLQMPDGPSQQKRYVLDTHVTADGSFVMCGYQYQPGGITYVYNMFLTKFDPSGNLLWDQLIDPADQGTDYRSSFGTSLTSDPDGNIYLGGSFASNSFVLGATTYTQTAAAPRGFVAKLDPSGTYLWVVLSGAISAPTGVSSVAYEDEGHLYAIFKGGSQLVQANGVSVNIPNTGYGSERMVRLDTDGLVHQITRFGQQTIYTIGYLNPDIITATDSRVAPISPRMEAGPGGRLYVSGFIDDNGAIAIMGADTITRLDPTLKYTGYMAVWDTSSGWASAFPTWATDHGNPREMQRAAFAPDSEGQVTVMRSWYAYPQAVIEPRLVLADGTEIPGDSGTVMMRWDMDGDLLWWQRHAYATHYDLACDGSRYLALAQFGQSAMFDAGGASLSTEWAGGSDVVLFRSDLNGVVQGARSFASAGFDHCAPIALHACGGVVFAGSAGDDLVVDGAQLHGTADEIYVLRFAEETECQATDCAPIIMAVRAEPDANEVHVFPNPSADAFRFTGKGIRYAEVFNGQGARMASVPYDGGGALRWSAEGLPAGIYFARIQTDGGPVTLPLQVTR